VGAEVEGFVSGDSFVAEFLARFKSHQRTWWAYASTLYMFFRWLRMVHGLVLDGQQLLDKHVENRASVKVQDRRWALRLALGFSRDNKDLVECADGRKYQMLSIVKGFFDYHEAPLTTSKNIYGRQIRRKFHPRQISVDDARRLLGHFNVRDRAILLVMLQSGMSIGDVLNKFSLMLSKLKAAIESGTQRFRVDFDERKGNGFNYFTFISVDALYELKKWLALREHWIDGRSDPGTVFVAKPISKNGEECTIARALSVVSFEVNFSRVVRKMPLKDGPWSVTPHMFRKLFKTESRAPERGVDQDCIEFMLGHSSGIQAVGGVYDRTPELHSEIIEKEFMKLEPYLNIYTGKTGVGRGLDLTGDELENLKWLAQQVKEGKVKIES
jgi:integrase